MYGAARASCEPEKEVPEPGPAVDMMLPHSARQRVNHVGLVSPPYVPALGTVVEFLHTIPLPALFPPGGTVRKWYSGVVCG